ncbi:potassium channel family protein [Amphibacillus jilinensis]|uniref:potassium channel family protein n=1 Tax=Amphibacillus jilinensis TaxID=1216008 RepID=UPI000301616F|nr:NAD-binding protein [Amphibacillus jilinensis]
MKKRILLIGGFNKARSLAQSLINRDYAVTVINKDLTNCKVLSEIERLTVILGDGSKAYVLEEANVKEMDVVIALTQHDYDNLVICELSKKRYKVSKTVALVNDAKKIDFFYKAGVDSVVCAVNAITNIIEQKTLFDGIANLLPMTEARINIAEIPISSSSKAINKRLWEISLPKEVIIACILRGEKSIVPQGDTLIQAGDILILISSNKQELTAIRELTGNR